MFAELQALVALAEAGSMERAAINLYLTPSALTRRIQRLEVELGVVLRGKGYVQCAQLFVNGHVCSLV